jgi:hypothetical protein
MITIECPSCDGAIRIEPDAAELRCDECAVRVPIAPDEVPPALPLAA